MDSNIFSKVIKYFTDNFSYEFILGDNKPKDKKEEIALEVFNRLNDIYIIYNRINLYPDYFERFYIYDDKKISEADALEYHIQNYLNDLYSFKVKIERLLGFMKNNLREFDIINMDDIKHAINHLLESTDKVFKQPENIRGKHVHDISVKDTKITEAKLFLQIIETVRINNINYVDVTKLPDKYSELVEESKQKYIKQSRDNSINVNKYFNFFISRVGYLIASLYGHNTEEFKNMIKLTNMEEYLDICDSEGNLIGTKELKTEAHKQGLWHRSVHVWVINSKGEVLLQKRSATRDNHPNEWDISAAGHVSAGEDYITSAQRETEEEIGLKVKPEDFIQIGLVKQMSKREGYINNEINPIYVIKMDLDPTKIIIQEEEVSEVKFMPYKELKTFIDNKDSSFCHHPEEYNILFKYLGDNYK